MNESEKAQARGDHWKRVAVEMEADRDRLLAEVQVARSVRVTPHSLMPLIDREKHSPAKVRAFLAANGWTLKAEHPQCSEWFRADVDRHGWAETGACVMVLDWTGFSDYEHHLAITVVDLAGLHGTGELAVLAAIEAAGPATPNNHEGD